MPSYTEPLLMEKESSKVGEMPARQQDPDCDRKAHFFISFFVFVVLFLGFILFACLFGFVSFLK